MNAPVSADFPIITNSETFDSGVGRAMRIKRVSRRRSLSVLHPLWRQQSLLCSNSKRGGASNIRSRSLGGNGTGSVFRPSTSILQKSGKLSIPPTQLKASMRSYEEIPLTIRSFLTMLPLSKSSISISGASLKSGRSDRDGIA